MTKKIPLFLRLLILLLVIAITALTTYHITDDRNDKELRRLRLLQAEELAELEKKYQAQGFDMELLLALDRLYAQNSLTDAEKNSMTEHLLHAYATATGDVYAGYYSAEDYLALVEERNSRFVGIGVLVFSEKRNDGLLVVSVFPDSPAAECGLMPGDVILSADGLSFGALTPEEAFERLKGASDTPLTITYLRDDKTAELTLTRRTVTELTVTAKMLQNDIAYVRISSFSAVTPTQLANAVTAMRENGAESFVFDLRGNPGGLVASLAECLGALLPDGPIVHIEYPKNPQNNYTYRTENGTLFKQRADGTDEVRTDTDMADSLSLPSAVLIDEGTASAGELFAAALRDYASKSLCTARIFGVTSVGKGTVQATYRVAGGRAFKFSVATYNPPYSANYNGIGVLPHEVVPLPPSLQGTPPELLSEEDDTQLKAATTWLTALQSAHSA